MRPALEGDGRQRVEKKEALKGPYKRRAGLALRRLFPSIASKTHAALPRPWCKFRLWRNLGASSGVYRKHCGPSVGKIFPAGKKRIKISSGRKPFLRGLSRFAMGYILLKRNRFLQSPAVIRLPPPASHAALFSGLRAIAAGAEFLLRFESAPSALSQIPTLRRKAQEAEKRQCVSGHSCFPSDFPPSGRFKKRDGAYLQPFSPPAFLREAEASIFSLG